MATIKALYASTMDYIKDLSIVSIYRTSTILGIQNAEGTTIGSFSIRNDPANLTPAIVRIGSYDYDSRDVLVKDWSHPLYENRTLYSFSLGSGTAYALGWCPDGQYLAVGKAAPNALKIFRKGLDDTFTDIVQNSTGLLSWIQALSWSHDGKNLAVADSTSGNAIRIKSLSRDHDQLVESVDSYYMSAATFVWGMTWSPDDRYLAVSVAGGPDLTIFEMHKTEFGIVNSIIPKTEILQGLNNPKGIAWSPDGRHLAVSQTAEPYLTIYEVTNGSTLTKVESIDVLPLTNTYDVAWSPGGKYLAVAHPSDRTLSVYKKSGNLFSRVAQSPFSQYYSVNSVTWSPDGRYIHLGQTDSYNKRIYKFENETISMASDLSGSGETARDSAFSPDGKYLASVSALGGNLDIFKSAMAPNKGYAIRVVD